VAAIHGNPTKHLTKEPLMEDNTKRGKVSHRYARVIRQAMGVVDRM